MLKRCSTGPVCVLLLCPLSAGARLGTQECVRDSVGHWKLCLSRGTEAGLAQSLPALSGSTPEQDSHAASVHHELRPWVLTRLLPILQVAPSEGTVTQIGLLSQDIHRLTVGL